MESISVNFFSLVFFNFTARYVRTKAERKNNNNGTSKKKLGFHHNHFSSINQSSRVSGLGFFYKKRKAFKKTREKVVKQGLFFLINMKPWYLWLWLLLLCASSCCYRIQWWWWCCYCCRSCCCC